MAQQDSTREMAAGSARTWSTADTLIAGLTIALCAVFTWLRWKKIDSLVMFDTPRWLNEGFRLASGETPYRDFSWQYPPLSLYLLGWSLRLFGISFTVVQALIDALSVAIVILSYCVARMLLPRTMQAATVGLLVAVCATNTKFPLFSMSVYTPAVLTATIGLLLLLIGMLSSLRSGRISPGSFLLLCSGFGITALSKPEALVASVLALVVFALVDKDLRAGHLARWLYRYTLLAATAMATPVVVYGSLIAIVGFSNLAGGVTGYGLASASCPWWPTGLGLCVMAASLGEAALVAALLASLRRRHFRRTTGRMYRRVMVFGVIGGLTWASWTCFASFDALTASGTSLLTKVRTLLPIFWINPLLMPAMWTAITVWIVVCGTLFRRRGSPRRFLFDARELAVILSFPVFLSVRSLFGHVLSPFPEVPAICYPFLLILGPYLMWRFLLVPEQMEGLLQTSAALRGTGSGSASRIVVTLLVGFIAVRLAAAYPATLSARPFRTLQTLSGSVRLSAYDVNSGVYEYVVGHTGPADRVLDLPYGGGMNFAARRRNSIFDTQFWYERIPLNYQLLDLRLFIKDPPALIIAQDAPDYGAYWGIQAKVGCSCPRLVWLPDHTEFRPGSTFPLVQYIRDHYHVDQRIGDRMLLLANAANREH